MDTREKQKDKNWRPEIHIICPDLQTFCDACSKTFEYKSPSLLDDLLAAGARFWRLKMQKKYLCEFLTKKMGQSSKRGDLRIDPKFLQTLSEQLIVE